MLTRSIISRVENVARVEIDPHPTDPHSTDPESSDQLTQITWIRSHTKNAHGIVHSHMRSSITSPQISARSSTQSSSSLEIDDDTARRMVEISLELETESLFCFHDRLFPPEGFFWSTCTKTSLDTCTKTSLDLRSGFPRTDRRLKRDCSELFYSAAMVTVFPLLKWNSAGSKPPAHNEIFHHSLHNLADMLLTHIAESNNLHRSDPVVCDIISEHDSAHRTEQATHIG